MSASPQGRLRGTTAEEVARLLARDEWYALAELMQRVGGNPVDTMNTLDHLRNNYAVLRVRAPCDTMTTLLRGDSGDPSTKRLLGEGVVNLWDLPFTLKKSFIAKYNDLYARLNAKRPLWRLVEVAVTVEEALEKTGLNTEHPRPNDGFPFQCVWRTNEPSRVGREYSVGVTFTGTIRTDDFKLYREIRGFNKKQLSIHVPAIKIKVCQNFTTLDALVGRATVDLRTKQLTYCPPRSALIVNTWEALIECASRQAAAEPFRPIRCKFSLLSGNDEGSGEE